MLCGQWSSGRHIITHMHTPNCFFANDSFVLFLPVSKKRLSWKWPFEDCTCGPIFSFLITYFGLIVTLGTIKKAASFIINNLIRVLAPRSQCKCYSVARSFPKPLKELCSHFVSKWHWWQTHSCCNTFWMDTGVGEKFRFRSVCILCRQEHNLLPSFPHFHFTPCSPRPCARSLTVFTGNHGQTSNMLNLSIYSSLIITNIQRQAASENRWNLPQWVVNQCPPSLHCFSLPALANLQPTSARSCNGGVSPWWLQTCGSHLSTLPCPAAALWLSAGNTSPPPILGIQGSSTGMRGSLEPQQQLC